MAIRIHPYPLSGLAADSRSLPWRSVGRSSTPGDARPTAQRRPDSWLPGATDPKHGERRLSAVRADPRESAAGGAPRGHWRRIETGETAGTPPGIYSEESKSAAASAANSEHVLASPLAGEARGAKRRSGEGANRTTVTLSAALRAASLPSRERPRTEPTQRRTQNATDHPGRALHRCFVASR